MFKRAANDLSAGTEETGDVHARSGGQTGSELKGKIPKRAQGRFGHGVLNEKRPMAVETTGILRRKI